MTYDLICLGNLTIDDIVLPDGETRMACFGGDAVYAALAGSIWSQNVQFVAPLGTDFPPEHLEKFSQVGWEIAGMPRRNVPSIRNWIVYETNGDRTWIPRHDAANFYELSPLPQDIPQQFLDARAFMILAMELEAQEKLAPFLKSRGSLVALDPQEDYIAGNHKRIFDLISHVDIFLPSQVEVLRLLGHTEYERAAREFASHGCRIVVIKLGAAGSLIYDARSDQFISIPIYPVKVVDTTGAGDAFCGGFMTTYAKSGDLLSAGLAGAVSASFAIEDFGLTHLFDIKPDEVRLRFERLAEMVKRSADELVSWFSS